MDVYGLSMVIYFPYEEAKKILRVSQPQDSILQE
jgi:hypothetical protein